MELKGGQNRFKAKAYNAGARALQGVGNLDVLVKEDRLTSLPRIGAALASQIKQLYLTGESSVLNELKQEFPPGILELSSVAGLSIAKIKQLHDELGIDSVASLRSAAEAGKIRDVKGFGAKTEQSLLNALNAEKKSIKRELYLHHAQFTADQIVEYLKTLEGVVDVGIAGSLRRWKETVDTIDVIVSATKPEAVLKRFQQFPLIIASHNLDSTSGDFELSDGARVTLMVVVPAQFPLALFAKTGSSAHVEKIQEYAVRKKVDLFKRLPATEESIYSRLKMQYVPPELREDAGEIEAAIAAELPEDLLTLNDIQGMVHCHTTYSDGKNSLEEMVRAAEAMGMKYITITDHSPTAFYANGVTTDRLKRQWDEIDEVQEKVKIQILRGTESDIISSGGLDYPDKILEKFDVIVASIHSRYKMNKEQMTDRIIKAMRQPVFKIWGHALGRLLQRRPPFECDVEKVLDVVSESRAAVEINGDPYRLDLEPRWVREARKRKIRFVISVDAHSTGALNNVRYGVGMARRGWVRRGEVLNTLNAKSFRSAVKPL